MLIKYIILIILIAIVYFAFNIETIESYTAEAKEEIKVVEIAELKSDNPELEIQIREKAIQYGLSPNTMVAIAMAESDLIQTWNYKYETAPLYYTAFGVYQITKSTYQVFCGNPDERFDVDKNVECAMIIASESGLHHWSESEAVWSKM